MPCLAPPPFPLYFDSFGPVIGPSSGVDDLAGVFDGLINYQIFKGFNKWQDFYKSRHQGGSGIGKHFVLKIQKFGSKTFLVPGTFKYLETVRVTNSFEYWKRFEYWKLLNFSESSNLIRLELIVSAQLNAKSNKLD